MRTDLRFAIFKAFAEAGIEIPFPQQDVYIKSMPDGSAGMTKPAQDALRPKPAELQKRAAEIETDDDEN